MKAMKQLAEAPRAGCQTPVQQQCSVGRGRDCMGLLCRAARVDTRIESVPLCLVISEIFFIVIIRFYIGNFNIWFQIIKTTFFQNKLDYPEFFDIRIQKIKKDLLSIEQQYFSKSLNILQLGNFGAHLTNCKQSSMI